MGVPPYRENRGTNGGNPLTMKMGVPPPTVKMAVPSLGVKMWVPPSLP